MHHFDPRRVRKHSSNVSLSSWAALYLIQYRFQECFTVRSRQETRGLRGIHMPHQRTDEVRDRRTVNNCLLYTSDAADDLLCVDLGGRRIIKKKKTKKKKIT